MTDFELTECAKEAMKKAYAPYSGFFVGAALQTKDGKVYSGQNIENAAFGPTNCAERTAFFKAISEGERDFEKIAVVGGKNGKIESITPPCGVCRQVMREFCNDDFKIIMGKEDGSFLTCTLKDLLPLSFAPENVK